VDGGHGFPLTDMDTARTDSGHSVPELLLPPGLQPGARGRRFRPWLSRRAQRRQKGPMWPVRRVLLQGVV